MPPLSRLGRQIQEVLAGLERAGASGALIGGLALAPHKVVRATQDVDLLVDEAHAGALDQALRDLGYRCVHRSDDAGNYLRGDERVDLLYANRPIARRLLESAKSLATPFGEIRVVSLEGLIAFKLQGIVNDPRRTQDLEDIRALLKANLDSVDMTELRCYFQLFEREALLDEILADLT
jgi:predicted nucleotidyltransferase